ncbi:MAG: PQQ-dependent dehydrogenase, methanol/ethanol family [Bryobacteraceae bacterium]
MNKTLLATFITALAMQIAPAQTAAPVIGKKVDDLALRNAAKNPAEWITYGVTQGETRYSALDQINASNVSRLGLAWTYDIPGKGGGAQEDTPLVWNGTMFGITNWSVVYALDARTGKEKWHWDPEVNRDAARSKICCGVVNRGLALYQGLIYAPVIDGRLVALDVNTGKPVWEGRVSYTQDGYSLTMAPRIAKGKVVIGVAGSEYPVRGFIQAFDALTGKPAWRFYTVPGDPSKPFENAAMKKAAETWGPDAWKLGGGGSVWDGMAYDPDANLLYFGTGNGGPWPEPLRNSKGKENLYVCSILAINPDNGELKWYYQNVPGDSWDYDSVQQLMLADITIKGQPRKVLMQANKNGLFYVLDRVTGQFISGQPFVKVNWAKGLDEKTGRPFINEGAHYGDEDIVKVMPGTGGAHNWAPMSFNPATGLVYIPTSNNTSFNFAYDKKFEWKPRMSNIGIKAGGPPSPLGIAPPPAEATAAPLPEIGADPLPGQRNVLLAWDPVTQTKRWAVPTGGGTFGGTVSTAGNLVLQVTPDGRLMAYTADKGEKVLELQTGLKGGMSPPITWQLDGKQYVTVLGGNGIVIGRNAEPGTPPPPPNANTVFPKMMTFVLDGAPMPAPAAN